MEAGAYTGYLGTSTTFPRDLESAISLDGAFGIGETIGWVKSPGKALGKTLGEKTIDAFTGMPGSGKVLIPLVKGAAKFVGLSKGDNTGTRLGGDAPGLTDELTRIRLLRESHERAAKHEQSRIDMPADFIRLNTGEASNGKEAAQIWCTRCFRPKLDSTHNCGEQSGVQRPAKFDKPAGA